ncbi:MAG: hypothetical protein ACJAQX_000713 [Polaribacter sp.]
MYNSKKLYTIDSFGYTYKNIEIFLKKTSSIEQKNIRNIATQVLVVDKTKNSKLLVVAN